MFSQARRNKKQRPRPATPSAKVAGSQIARSIANLQKPPAAPIGRIAESRGLNEASRQISDQGEKPRNYEGKQHCTMVVQLTVARQNNMADCKLKSRERA